MSIYTIGQLSQETGCHIESIRQYERKGLIKKPYRTESGHIRYNEQHASVLKLIMQFRRADFSLQDIKSILDDLNDDYAPCGKIENHGLKYAYLIEKKKKALHACEEMLGEIGKTCITCHKANKNTIINDCPLVSGLISEFEPKKLL